MNHHRRQCLLSGMSLAQVCLAWPLQALANSNSASSFDVPSELHVYPDHLFRNTQTDTCLALIASGLPLLTGKDAMALVLDLPDVADNGAAVPVAVRCLPALFPKLDQRFSLAIVVDKNPFVLSAMMHFSGGTPPAIKTRIKMNETSDVYAVLKTNNACYVARKQVRVTLGGCVA